MKPLTVSKNELSILITSLSDENGLVRQRARLNLVHIGKAGIPALIEALKSQNVHTRWEAVKILGELRATETAAPLANLLLDYDTGIRWSAMESLIYLGRVSLRPLLELFTKNFDSPLMREGLHHILHVFKDRYLLTEQEIVLFEKLHDQRISGFLTSWNSEAAWTAEKVLEALDKETKEKDKN
jgi:hypothetical protein